MNATAINKHNSLRSACAEAKSLKDLAEILNLYDAQWCQADYEFFYNSLPTFGGDEPPLYSCDQISDSWDETRVLIENNSGKFIVIDRP
jgi:hypothetical protein